MSAVIWNKDEHSMADLPNEILAEIFKYIRGLHLMRLRNVCTRFNNFIIDSPDLASKIMFKMLPIPKKSCFVEGGKILAAGDWNPDSLSIHRIRFKESDLNDFQDCRENWKHLRMRDCSFESGATMVDFLSIMEMTLETLLLGEVYVPKRQTDPIRTVVLPMLRKLETSSLLIDIQCTELTELTMKGPRFSGSLHFNELLETNKIEVLTLSYDHIEHSFKGDDLFQRALVHIKKFVINNSPHSRLDEAKPNFLRFMIAQTKIEEVNIETISKYVIFMPHLRTILGSMKSVKKLTIRIGDEHIYPVVEQLPPNNNITELCFERKMDENTTTLFTRIVEACPQIKKLKVYNFEQLILEEAFVHMENLEFIEAFMIKLEEKQNMNRLLGLERVKFAKLHVVNRPELLYKTLREQNDFVLGRLRGTSTS